MPYSKEDKDSKITKLMVQKFELEAHGTDKCIIPLDVLMLKATRTSTRRSCVQEV